MSRRLTFTKNVKKTYCLKIIFIISQNLYLSKFFIYIMPKASLSASMINFHLQEKFQYCTIKRSLPFPKLQVTENVFNSARMSASRSGISIKTRSVNIDSKSLAYRITNLNRTFIGHVNGSGRKTFANLIVNFDHLRKNLSFICFLKETKMSKMCRLKGNTIAIIMCMRLAKP